jgi:hypothetical protein
MIKWSYLEELIADFIYFTILVAVPSSFFGLVNELTFYIPGYFDLSLFSWLLAVGIIFWKANGFKSFTKLPGSKLVLIVIAYILLVFVTTLGRGVGFAEAFVVFRKMYYTPVSFLGLILYLVTINDNRIRRLFVWLVVATVTQAVMFILDNYLNLDIFAVSNYVDITIGNVWIKRHTLAFPIFGGFVFLLSVLLYLSSRRISWIVSLTVIFLAMLLVSVRSTFFVYLEYLLLGIMMFMRYLTQRLLIKGFALIFSLTIIFVLYSSFFPSNRLFFVSILDEVIVSRDASDVVNYSFRINLIQTAYDVGVKTDSLLFGNGYCRAGHFGLYDLAMGADSDVAALIYTEGIFGIFIRALPLLALILVNVKEFLRGKDDYVTMLNVFSITFISAEILNVVQTAILRDYSMAMFCLLAIEIHKRNYRTERRRMFQRTMQYGNGDTAKTHSL